MFIFFYLSIFVSFLFFCLRFLNWDPLKSCVMMCLGVLLMGCYVSLGIHVWYCYFIVLIFISGIFSLLTYFCSISNLCDFRNFYYIFFSFLVCFFFVYYGDFSFDFFFYDFNFLVIYYDFSYYYVFWIVFVLLLFLRLVSFNFDGSGYMRRL